MKKFSLLISLSLLCFYSNAQYVTIYGFYNTINSKHFYSINPNEVTVGTGGWVHDANLNRLRAAPIAGHPSVYRYYNTSTGAHFYSVSATPPSGFNPEGVMGVEAIVPETLYDSLQNVYGYYNPSTHDYYFSLNATAPTGWTAIGVQFQTFP